MRGEAWFQDMPDDWSSASVKYLFDIQLGKMLQPERQSPSDRLTKYLKAQHVQWHSVTTTNLPEMWASPKEINQYSVKNGDLLVCEGGEAGRSAVIQGLEEEAIIQNALHRVRSNKNNARFLEYVLHSVHTSGWFDVLCNKATIAHFTGEKFGAMQIPLPPLKTQKAIATFLDRKTAAIDTLIAKKQRLIQLLEEKRTALINQAVTKGLNVIAPMKDSGIPWIGEIPEHWGIKKLKFLTSKIGSGVTPTGGASVYQSQGVPFLRSQNIHSDGIRINDIAFISEQIHNQMSSSKVCPNDVLLNITGASIGRCSIVPDSLLEANVNQHVCIIRSKQKILPKFLHNYLVSEKGQYQIFRSENGISREGLNFEQIKSFYIVKPSPSEEQEIALWLECKTTEIGNLITKTRISIEKLQEYRRSLITAAVTGKLDITQEKTP